MLYAPHTNFNLNFAAISGYRLFAGFTPHEVEDIFTALQVRVRGYEKGETILREGEKCAEIGVILKGEVVGETFSESGKRDIVAFFSEGLVFGQLLAASGKAKSPVTLTSRAKTLVAFLAFDKLFSLGAKDFSKLFRNLAEIIADEYFALLFRANCLSQPTIREKILFFLHEKRLATGSDVFEIPLGRAEMADFLSADRSSLSRELSRLKSEGVIDFKGRKFVLKTPEGKDKR